MEREYHALAGKKITIDGETYYTNEYYSHDGMSYGYVYKDEKAFKENPKEVCYIPEHGFDDAEEIEINGETYYRVNGYTREDLEALVEGEIDEDGDAIDVEYFFDKLEWAFPETYLYEMAA